MPSGKLPAQTGLTFSQAQGLEPLPQPLALGEISYRFRVDVWNWLYSMIDSNLSPGKVHILGPWVDILRSIHANFLHFSLDTFDDRKSNFVNNYKNLILQQDEWQFNQIFDFIQFVLRLLPRRPELKLYASQRISEVRSIFRTNMLAYDVLNIPPDGPTVVPTATPEEGDSIRQAFSALAASPFDGARSHLRNAAEALNAGLAADAIREAVHAVESAVRVIAPNQNFNQALSALDAKSALHPALRKALMSLYGYSSDEKGIRHPLLESDVAQVGMDEAVFMFGACASFISYLINRARHSGMLKG